MIRKILIFFTENRRTCSRGRAVVVGAVQFPRKSCCCQRSAVLHIRIMVEFLRAVQFCILGFLRAGRRSSCSCSTFYVDELLDGRKRNNNNR